MITDSILNEINENKKFIEAQTSFSKNFKENLKLIEKTCKRVADANTNSIIK